MACRVGSSNRDERRGRTNLDGWEIHQSALRQPPLRGFTGLPRDGRLGNNGSRLLQHAKQTIPLLLEGGAIAAGDRGAGPERDPPGITGNSVLPEFVVQVRTRSQPGG